MTLPSGEFPISFLVTSNGVSPLKGSNALDLGRTLAGRGVGQNIFVVTLPEK
ncbi:hypothetical protein SUSAZ_10345 [Sulfolobus acidocaldarius SUSAZ]|nr:hypothetical protein SUSAZ_10345 [Sulfolobus acidocaldarius SUSAZ]